MKIGKKITLTTLTFTSAITAPILFNIQKNKINNSNLTTIYSLSAKTSSKLTNGFIKKKRPLLQGISILDGYRASMFEDKEGNLWIMTMAKPLQVLRNGQTEWEEAGHGSNITNGWEGKIFQDKEGNLWTMGSGTPLQVLRSGKTEWEEAGHGSKIDDGYGGTIFQDKDGNLWAMGRRSPLQVLRNGQTEWEDAADNGSNITDGDSGTIFQDKDGNIWSMGPQSPLQVLRNGQTQWEEAGHGSNIVSGTVATIFQDKDGNLWTMTMEKPLQVLRNGQTEWEDAADNGSNITKGLGGTIFQDKDGNLWSMSIGKPLQVLRDGQTQWEEAGHGSNITNGRDGKIFQDKDGNLWTTGSGTPLQVLRNGQTQWEEAGHGSNINNGQGGIIFQDKEGNLWTIGWGRSHKLQVLRNGETEWSNKVSELKILSNEANKEQQNVKDIISKLNVYDFFEKARDTNKTSKELSDEIGSDKNKLKSILGIDLDAITNSKDTKIESFSLIPTNGNLDLTLSLYTQYATIPKLNISLKIETLSQTEIEANKKQDTVKNKIDKLLSKAKLINQGTRTVSEIASLITDQKSLKNETGVDLKEPNLKISASGDTDGKLTIKVSINILRASKNTETTKILQGKSNAELTPSSKTGLIMGIVLGGLGVLSLSACSIIFKKKNKKIKKN